MFSVEETPEQIQTQIAQLQKKLENIKKINQVDERILSFMESDTDLDLMIHREVKNVIITSPTQVGKTARFINNYRKMAQGSVLTTYSCDNSKAQLAQLCERLEYSLVKYYTAQDLSKKKTVKEIDTTLENGGNVLIIMLNNSAQIQKLNGFVGKMSHFKKYVLVHDEGDTVNKTCEGKAQSQTQWNNHVNLVRGMELRGITRIWISATPENVAYIQDVGADDVIVLPTPDNYVGISDHYSWHEEDTSMILYELNRIRAERSGEIILYCTERFKMNQEQSCMDLSRELKCIAMCYNGDGICIYVKGTRVGMACACMSDCLFKIKDLATQLGVVIVGHKLMDRGISFVSSGTEPLTATVMFYNGGNSTYAVSLAQRFGRITGTSRPDLKRRALYCPTEVYNDYRKYIDNQNIVYASLKKGDGLIKDLFKTEGVCKLSRALDRMALCKVNREYRDDCGIAESKNQQGKDEDTWVPDKMKRLVKSWASPDNNTQIAKLFRAMVSNGGMMANEEVFGYFGLNSASNAISGHNRKLNWNTVFVKQDDYHYIRQEAMDYYNTL